LWRNGGRKTKPCRNSGCVKGGNAVGGEERTSLTIWGQKQGGCKKLWGGGAAEENGGVQRIFSGRERGIKIPEKNWGGI